MMHKYLVLREKFQYFELLKSDPNAHDSEISASG